MPGHPGGGEHAAARQLTQRGGKGALSSRAKGAALAGGVSATARDTDRFGRKEVFGSRGTLGRGLPLRARLRAAIAVRDLAERLLASPTVLCVHLAFKPSNLRHPLTECRCFRAKDANDRR